jgi:hypothetical protein
MPRILETISHFYIGVDLGQKQDYTALCILERAETCSTTAITSLGSTIARPAMPFATWNA